MIIGSANITDSPRCFSDASQWVVSADEAQLGRSVLVRLLAFARLIFAFFPNSLKWPTFLFSWLAAFQAAVPTDGKLTGRQVSLGRKIFA